MQVASSLFFFAVLALSLYGVVHAFYAHWDQILNALKGDGASLDTAMVSVASPAHLEDRVIILFKPLPKEQLLELPLAA